MLRLRVTTDAMMGHLAKLQEIANSNGGNRAVFVEVLRGKGFDVRTREFEVNLPVR